MAGPGLAVQSEQYDDRRTQYSAIQGRRHPRHRVERQLDSWELYRHRCDGHPGAGKYAERRQRGASAGNTIGTDGSNDAGNASERNIISANGGPNGGNGISLSGSPNLGTLSIAVRMISGDVAEHQYSGTVTQADIADATSSQVGNLDAELSCRRAAAAMILRFAARER